MANQKIILAVDDMVENLTLIRSMLKDYFDVRLAKSAKLALALLSTQKVDLILLDIEMPGMSGFEFLRQLQEKEPLNKTTPVIFVTSHAEIDFIDRAINSGAKDYILKPIKADSLHKKIGAVLDMPINQAGILEAKLNDLLTAVVSADSSKVEAIIKELQSITSSHDQQIRQGVQAISELVLDMEYEQGILKIKEFLHNISLKRKW